MSQRHAPGPIDIVFFWDEDEAVLTVTDSGPGYSIEQTRLPTEFSESSRGLFLIDQYAKSFRVSRAEEHTITRVTFRDIKMKCAPRA